MSILLRKYQKDTLNKLYKKLLEHNRVALSLPTGAGKTVMMAQWANVMKSKGKKTAIIVDRVELVQQTYELLPNASVLKSGWPKPFNSNNDIFIIMLQTAYSRQNVLLDLNVDYVMFDEIQNYANGQMFSAICDCWQNAKIIGVSATPIDDKGYLLEQFDDVICDIQTQDLIDLQCLVKPIHYTPNDYNLDLSMIRITNGDYDSNQLDEIMTDTSKIEQIYNQWNNIANDKKTIAFCSSVKQAVLLNEYFIKKGIKSNIVHGNLSSDSREQILRDFENSKIQVLFNVNILVAGYNEPSVQCILFANPTKILRRYLQQAGRGLRTCKGKDSCIMLDCANNVREHGFCNDIRVYRKRQRIQDTCNVKQCPECGAIVNKSTQVCPYCGYQFTEQVDKGSKTTKRQIAALEKAFNMQQELKQQIAQLVEERHYKNGYKWYLFIDCLKTKQPTESAIRFFKRKLTKIKNIKKKGWKLASLRYN